MGDGGDFNEIKSNEEKQGHNRRQKGNFSYFRNFISEIGMGDIRFKEHTFTWANNREGEDFIQERLDRFFGSDNLMLQFNTAKVAHILIQVSDHSRLVLNSKPS